MLIVMQNTATEAQIRAVCKVIEQLGFEAHEMPGTQRTAVCVTGNDGSVSERHFAGLHGIRDIIRVSKPYKLTSNEVKTTPTVVSIGQAKFGNGHFDWLVGPACVEDETSALRMAETLAGLGVKVFHASLFRPRSNPYQFQGLGEAAIPILQKVKAEFGLAVVAEVINIRSVEPVSEVADVLIVDSHNMQNFALLKHLGKQKLPVMLKRAISANIEDWLMSAEHILSGGNNQVLLCEAGIRTFCDHSKLTLDLAVVPALQKLTHLPVIVDPSQAAGASYLVPALARAARAAGAHGVMLECHDDPARSKMGGAHAIVPSDFQQVLA